MTPMDRFRPTRMNSDEGWFRVGTVEVTSAVLLAVMCTLSMFVYAVDRSVLDQFVLTPAAFENGQVWRFFTWWLVNPPDLWVAISIAIFWWIGRLIERDLGKARFLWFIGTQILLTSVLTTLFAVLTDNFFALPGLSITQQSNGGSDFLEISVIVAVAVAFPRVRSFFNIPFWVMAAVIVALAALRFTGDSAWAYLVMLMLTCAFAVLMMRAMGLAEQEVIPKIPLPAFITGDPYQKANRARAKAQRKQSKPSGGGLKRTKNEPAAVVPIRPEARLDRADQADMDWLLDKISASGMDSLTPDERRRLDEHSRRLRGQ